MEVLDYVEAYLNATKDDVTLAADFHHDGVHIVVEEDDKDEMLPKAKFTIVPDDDTDVDAFRALAFNFLQQIYSETTNNDVCQMTVRERYDLLASELTYEARIEDYMT